MSKSSELTDEMKHLLIIPFWCAFTRLVVLKYHTDNLHVGVQHTCLSTRKKFWIVNGHASVKHYLNQCGRCALEKAKTVRQLMADLTADRISVFYKPFTVCGLDYFGHINYVEGRSTKKAWGFLFACMASRAVHAAITTFLSLKEFLLAFSRFNDVRGRVEVIYSDSGSTFQTATKALPKLLHSTKLRNSLRGKGIRWEFITPYARLREERGNPWLSRSSEFCRELWIVQLTNRISQN